MSGYRHLYHRYLLVIHLQWHVCGPDLVPGECTNIAGGQTIARAQTFWALALEVDIFSDVPASSRSNLLRAGEDGEPKATAASRGLLVAGPQLTVRQARSRVSRAGASEERCGAILVILARLAARRRILVSTNAVLVGRAYGPGTV